MNCFVDSVDDGESTKIGGLEVVESKWYFGAGSMAMGSLPGRKK